MSVYTPVTESELNHFLKQYDIGELQRLEGISAGIENTNYFVDTTQGRYVLTLFEHHSKAELSYFLALMETLANAGVPTAKPIKQKTGDILSILNGKPASLVTRLKGETLLKQEPNFAQCEAIGTALAKMHIAAQDFPQQRKPDRGFEWRKQAGEELLQQNKLTSADKQILETELQAQEAIDYKRLPSGVIHADLFRDNAMFDGDTLSGIIDLYYACNDNFLFDIAVVANDWCYHPDGSINEQKLSIFLNAYHRVRPLSQDEHRYWFAMLRAAALRFWLSRLKDKLSPREGEITQVKNPEEFKAKLEVINQSQTIVENCWVDALENS